MSWDICLRDEDNPKITGSSVIASQIFLSLKFGPVFFLPNLLFKVVAMLSVQQFFEQHMKPRRRGEEISDWFLLRPCPQTHSLPGLPQAVILHWNKLFSKNRVYLQSSFLFHSGYGRFLISLCLLWPCCYLFWFPDSPWQSDSVPQVLSIPCSSSRVPEVSSWCFPVPDPFNSGSSLAPVGRQAAEGLGQGTLHRVTLSEFAPQPCACIWNKDIALTVSQILMCLHFPNPSVQHFSP